MLYGVDGTDCAGVPLWWYRDFEIFDSEPEEILIREELGDVPPLN